MRIKTRDRILAMMRDNPGGFTIAAMADELDMQEKATSKALDGLVSEGRLERCRNENCIAFGKAKHFYRLAPKTGETR